MRKIILPIIGAFLLIGQIAFAQTNAKPVIDSTAIADWPRFEGKSFISKDGAFVSYSYSGKGKSKITVLRSTKNDWRKEYLGKLEPIAFSADSKQFIYKRQDTLFFQHTGSDQVETITNIASSIFKTSETNKISRIDWLAYQQKSNKTLRLINLVKNQEVSFGDIKSYDFDPDTKGLLLVSSIINHSDHRELAIWYNLLTSSADTIWRAKTVNESFSQAHFDEGHAQFAFVVQATVGDKVASSLWYYKQGSYAAIEKVNNNTIGIPDGKEVGFIQGFNKNGEYLLLGLTEKGSTHKAAKPNGVKVDVWNYKDVNLQSEQLGNSDPNYSLASICINANVVVLLTNENEDFFIPFEKSYDQVFLWTVPRSMFWRKAKYWTVSLKTGSRKEFPLFNHTESEVSISPDGKWLIYFDKDKNKYFSYDLKTGEQKNISIGVIRRLDDESNERSRPGNRLANRPRDICWMKDNSRLFVYDNYDIWCLDPSGKAAAVNATQGYGSKHYIEFSIIDKKCINDGFEKGSQIILGGRNMTNSYFGLYRLTIDNKCRIESLVVPAPCLMNAETNRYAPNNAHVDPILFKASDANAWLFAEQGANKAPNYLFTTDFKNIKQLTDFQPEKNYNWLTAEIIHFKQLDGKSSQGILYKPENFDPHKKYPVIFNYYELMTKGAFSFMAPNYNIGNVNIPWLVSRGYLVFCPDIHYTIGHPGRSAYNAVVAGARMIAKLPYVDAKHMAINGHSFGSTETNYIVSHSNLFAAAFTASGTADMISEFGYEDKPGADWTETGQGRMNRPPALSIRNYIDESPVLFASKVTTPLLMMYNKKDFGNYLQGIEFFINLRRFHKKAWLLQYDEGGHTVNGKEAIDLTTRVQQFFDHYLKGEPAPVWMTHGIPTKLKGIDDGLALDPMGTP